MNFLKKLLKYLLILGIIGYALICILLYFYQESLLFHPEKLEQDFTFEFRNEFVERDITTNSGNTINSLLFTQDNSKGVIFYLHGNANSLKSVGNVSENFLPLGYDIFMIDYPGYGKSTNEINDQEVLFNDVQFVYEDLKKSYDEKNIVVMGYSIGTGIAAHLTADNDPATLILHAPYYSMTDMMQRTYPFIPTSILKYDLLTYEYLKNTDVPVHIFHGVDDTVIPLESAVMLSKELNLPLYRLQDQGHRDVAGNETAINKLAEILSQL